MVTAIDLYRQVIIGLKSDTILNKKPHLKICSNHRVDKGSTPKRIWISKSQGTAIKRGNWYEVQ